MSEKSKHPSLEPVPIPDLLNEKTEPKLDVASLEMKHKMNLEEKQRLTEITALLEADEADLSRLRQEVLELIRQRLLKK